jgi:O-antigen/teichoic acid export membrane protein
VGFLSVPLTLGYLGAERYGVWTTLGSLLAWLQLADLGMGNGLTNAVTAAVGKDRPDLVRIHISSALCVLAAVALMTGIVAATAWPWIDWNALFGVSTPGARAELGPAIAAALAIFLMQFPLAVIGKVYVAYQEGRIGNYWGMASNVLSLVALLIVTHTQGGLVWLVIAVSGTGLMVALVNGSWLFLRHKPFLAPRLDQVRLWSIKEVSHVGGKFFLIQIMALVMFQTDNFVIAHYLGAERVPPYSVTYSLFGYTSLLQSLLFFYVWAAYTEAIARDDIAWVRRTFRLNLALSVASTTVMAGALVVVAKPFIVWWAGPAAEPSTELVLWMAAWSVINAFTSPISCLLASAAHLKAQIVYSGVGTVCNIALSIALVQVWGVTGVIAGTVISYLTCVCIPAYVDSRILLRKLSHAL